MFGTINCSFYALVGIDLIFLVWCLCALPWAQFLCWETASNPRIISQWLTVPPYTTFMSTLYNFLYLRFNFIYDQHLMLRVYTITCHPRRSSTEWSLNHIVSYLGSLLISSMKPTFSWALLCTGSFFLSSLWSQGGRPRSTTTDYLPFTCHIFYQLLLNVWKYKTCSLVRESNLLRDWLYLWQKVSGLSSHCPPFFLFSEEETNNSRDFWGVVKKGSRKFCLMVHVPLSFCTLPLKNVVTSNTCCLYLRLWFYRFTHCIGVFQCCSCVRFWAAKRQKGVAHSCDSLVAQSELTFHVYPGWRCHSSEEIFWYYTSSYLDFKISRESF